MGIRETMASAHWATKIAVGAEGDTQAHRKPRPADRKVLRHGDDPFLKRPEAAAGRVLEGAG